MALLSPGLCLRLLKNISQSQFKPSSCLKLSLVEAYGYAVFNSNVNLKVLIHTTTLLTSQKKFDTKPGVKVQKVVTEDGVVEVKKKVFLPKVTLLTHDGGMQVVTLEEANKIAKRRNLKVVKINDWDPKTERPTFKLLSAAEFLELSKQEKVQKTGHDKKNEKLLNVNSKISDHDLQSKIKHVIKWLDKELTVRVVISGDPTNMAPAETVYDTIADSVKDAGRIVQKVCKGGEIKFHIILPKKHNKKPEHSNSEEAVKPNEKTQTEGLNQ